MQEKVDTWWHELSTWDALEARNFYRKTLGWSFEKISLPEGEPYWIARKAGKAIGGLYCLSDPKFKGIPAHWMTYMAVDDIEKAQQETENAGGEINRKAANIPGIGKIAVVSDASGALIGLIERADDDLNYDDAEDFIDADDIEDLPGEHPTTEAQIRAI